MEEEGGGEWLGEKREEGGGLGARRVSPRRGAIPAVEAWAEVPPGGRLDSTPLGGGMAQET